MSAELAPLKTAVRERADSPGHGTDSGWIRFKGETFDISPDRCYASRDHS